MPTLIQASNVSTTSSALIVQLLVKIICLPPTHSFLLRCAGEKYEAVTLTCTVEQRTKIIKLIR